MGLLHLLVILLIGVIVGIIADILTLQRVPGGLFSFMGLGMLGGFALDMLFRNLVVYGLVPWWFYSKQAVLIEIIIGAGLFTYLFNLIKWDYK